jgi:ribosomal-protein-alanine N-acetyltransferase
MTRSFLSELYILKTERLVLRTWTEKDLNSGFDIWGDHDVMKFVDSCNPKTLEQVRASIIAGIKHQEKFGFQHWAVIENKSQKIIGACGFNKTENDGEIELVFHFTKAFWGQGYATEAAKACVEYSIEKLGPKKIVAGCHPENEASKKVLIKAGLTFVGNRWFDDTQQEEPCFELVL